MFRNNFHFLAKKFHVQMSVKSWRVSIAQAGLWEEIESQAVYDLSGIYTRLDLGKLEEK